MDSLFDQLKSGAPIECSTSEPTPLPRSPSSSPPPAHTESPALRMFTPSPPSHLDTPPASTTKKVFNNSLDSLESKTVTSPRRESMPPPNSGKVYKSNNKSRSLSPTNASKITKPLKVLIERSKKIEQSKVKVNKNMKNGEKSSPMFTPTKAQQKLFDPAVLEKAQQLTQPKLKRCVVRVQRQNLKNLQAKMLKLRKKKVGRIPKKAEPTSSKSADGIGKRKANSSSSSLDSSASPSKQARMSKLEKPSFFIKLNTGRVDSPVNKKTTTTNKKTKLQTTTKKQKSISSTKPTKFTRTQLIKAYGKRFFRAHVKIERCSHPMMLIFESNARARRLQAKRNKSKNLSVSFREQVEIFGDSSDSEVSVSDLDLEASTSKSAKSKATPLLVTPARLKKVENGKVVDDIELDPSLFVVPQELTASTPFTPRARKKREKKSYSPLKDDGTPSPRKEQLKLANEKMPPSGLRRLTIDDVDEDDDEDDECEYIVPIEIPARRSSRGSSMSVADESISGAKNVATSIPVETKDDKSETPKKIAKEAISERLISPEDQTNVEREKTNNNKEEPTNKTDVVLPQERFGSISPAQSLNSLTDLVDSLINNSSQEKSTDHPRDEVTKADKLTTVKQNNEAVDNVPKLVTDDVCKLGDNFDDDISLQLFTEDDTQNMEDNAVAGNQLVDGIINERIDELAKEKTTTPLCTQTPPREISAE